MAIINLRDYYPFYTSDCFMEVSEEVAEMFKEFDRKEAAYRLRTYRHKAYYSLDRDDGLEHEAVFVALSPHELYERKVTMQELHRTSGKGRHIHALSQRRFSMTQAVTYERETKSVAFQGKIIVLESLTPVLPPKEKEQRKKEIERCLFEVFSKYGDRFP